MDNILEKGTKVLIFPYIDINSLKKNYDNYITGQVLNVKSLENNLDNTVYEVISYDGKLYYATHQYPRNKISFYIRTPEEHINSLKEYIKSNEAQIVALKNENDSINKTIDTIEKPLATKTR